VLYQLGAVSFEVQPVNADHFDMGVGADFAAHEVVGAMRAREFMGQADTPVRLSGKLFPRRLGWGSFDALKSMATAGTPQILIRGDGAVLGWMLILHVRERHTYLDDTGVGRVVEFDIEMTASPTGASAGAMISLLGALVSSIFG
jgi:hypothetical protein